MLLWDIIYGFFAKYIWGGYYVSSNGAWLAFQRGGLINATDVGVPSQVGNFATSLKIYGDLTLADWLNTTSTIIVLIGICIFLYLVTKYLFKFVAGLFKW